MRPLQLAVFGDDNFRSGGSDEGAGYWAFTGLALVFLAWSLAVLAIGVREMHGWTIIRAIGSFALAVLALLGLGVAALFVGG